MEIGRDSNLGPFCTTQQFLSIELHFHLIRLNGHLRNEAYNIELFCS
jgi:hypothetical protein